MFPIPDPTSLPVFNQDSRYAKLFCQVSPSNMKEIVLMVKYYLISSACHYNLILANFFQVYWLTAPKQPVPEPGTLEMEEEQEVVINLDDMEVVSSLEDMEEGEIHDDTMEELAASQEEETVGEEHAALEKKKRKRKRSNNSRVFASGTVPKKEGGPFVRLNTKPGKKRDLRLPLNAQFALNPSPDRIYWLQQLLSFMEKIGSPILWSPSEPQLVCPGPESVIKALDLYLLYKAVKEEGGGGACTANMSWKNIAGKLFLPQQKAFMLKKLYDRYLLPFEENEVCFNSLIVLSYISFPKDERNARECADRVCISN